MRPSFRRWLVLMAVSLSCACSAASAGADPGRFFAIQVVDGATGRGVPLIELATTNQAAWWTDSAGWVAFDEPGLMDGQEVYFHVRGDGYEAAADGFGFRGARLHPVPGGEARIEVRRTNIVERLYRVTGAGIYRDSVLLGREVPLRQPVLSGRVMGQDSVQAIVFAGKVRWFWGDTGRPAYPLGNFATSGAVSLLPADGGLAPDRGVDLEYFVDAAGFSRAMVDDPREGLKWIDGLMVLEDPDGVERLVGRCERVRRLGEDLGRSLIVYDEARDVFVPLVDFPLETPLAPKGRPFRHVADGVEYFYFPAPFPMARVPATWEAVLDPARYEGFTCLEAGAAWDADAPRIERDTDGRPVWGWKVGGVPLGPGEQKQLVEAGLLEPDQACIDIRDPDTGKFVHLWGGTVAWNACRERWLMIATEFGGTPSTFGEVWLAEADRPEGPWRSARKIASHARHTFYNPVHHTFFDEEGGCVIYFEGTYSDMFSNGAAPTPRYAYNQILYRLDLRDGRL